jgi:NTE family protein
VHATKVRVRGARSASPQRQDANPPPTRHKLGAMTAPLTALVLSGGGSRGAYEAGAVLGLVEALELGPNDPAPFQVFTGTSVGALNVTFLASKAHLGHMAASELADHWRTLRLRTHARVRARALLHRAAIDLGPVEEVVRRAIDWPALSRNLSSHTVAAVVLASLHVGTGRTVLFADLAPGHVMTASRDPARLQVQARLTADHVLASAAIPGVFPPRRIGDALFYDGGLRFNTPIAPAIRAGADRLVVVSPRFSAPPVPVSSLDELDDGQVGAPDLTFLMGKMLDALLLDPFAYDLEVLQRFNQFVRLLDETVTPANRKRFDDATIASRGQPYRTLDTFVIAPTDDIGRIANEHIRRNRLRVARQGVLGLALAALAGGSGGSDSDLLSYLLFDGGFAGELIELGRRDALARTAELRAFFGH